MGSRERKRAERRKRKQRGAGSPATGPAAAEEVHSNGEAPAAEAKPSRSELKDKNAREALDPLHQGERPLVVTIGALISGSIALSVIVSYLLGAEVNGDKPHFGQVLAPTVLMGMMAYGMWRARYWAVLGFQVILVLLLLVSGVGLTGAQDAGEVAGRGGIFIVSGVLFYFMIKAMARIQMPQRLPPE
jgi:hypothetical protein